ncbi:MAG: AAA family ATPase, partial [Phycisphaerales bacterium]
HSAKEALLPQPPICYLVEGIISQGSVTIVTGEAGDGKTWSLLDLGVCVAGGIPWIGDYQTKQGNVLFIDEESGLTRFNLRLKKVMSGHGVDDSLPLYFTSLSLFDLTKKGDLQELDRLVKQLNISLVIVDAFTDVIPGVDENLVKDIGPVMAGLRTIAESNKVAIVLIHHNNKRGSYRGSTALKGAVDNLISISKSDSYVTFKSEKTRDTEPFKFSARMVFESDKFYIIGGQKEKIPQAQEYVIQFLAQNGVSSTSDIKSKYPKPEVARKAIFDLEKNGITKKISGSNGIAGFWDLTEKGVKVALQEKWFIDPWKVVDYAYLYL